MAPAELRFIEAFELLRSAGKIGVREFCREVGEHPGTFGTWKSGKSNRRANVEWFSALCGHGVSADWLLTGNGPMMKG